MPRAWADQEVTARQRFNRVAGPELERLSQDIDLLEGMHRELLQQLEGREKWLLAHPEAARRLDHLDRDLARAERRVAPSVTDDFIDLLERRGVIAKSAERHLGLEAGIDFGP